MASPDRKELQAQWKTKVEVPALQPGDVAKHTRKDDLWMIIHGKVYDVTKYWNDHPGGADVMFEVAGKDATSAFEDVGHSDDAREILHPYLVGVVAGHEETEDPQKSVQVVHRGSAHHDKTSATKSLQNNAVPAGVALVSIAGVVVLSTVARSTSLYAHLPNSGGGFTSGFLIASTLAAGIGSVAYSRLSKALQFGGSYSRFPAHVHPQGVIPSIHQHGFLKAQEYQTLPLILKETLSADSYRLVFKLPSTVSVLGLPIGQHVTIRGYYDDDEGHHTVSRSYTPVSNNKDLGRLELVIKMYNDGRLTGRYLNNLQVGDQVEFRGPKGAMKYRKDMSKHIGMIAGGTGITPMYQLIRAICEDKTDETTVHLLYASKTPEDMLLRKQLDRYQAMAPKKFFPTYIIDKATPGWTGEVGFINKKLIEGKLPEPGADSKILLCGPPGMINACKKSLVELGFKAPGAVTKLTDEIFLF